MSGGQCGAFCSFCGRCGRAVAREFAARKPIDVPPPGVIDRTDGCATGEHFVDDGGGCYSGEAMRRAEDGESLSEP